MNGADEQAEFLLIFGATVVEGSWQQKNDRLITNTTALAWTNSDNKYREWLLLFSLQENYTWNTR